MNWFLSLLEKHGRKEILVDIFGHVHWERYYLFYYENGQDGCKNFLPNAYIHHFPTNSPDGEDSHSHPWPTIGFILKGGYKELINNAYIRISKRFSFARLSHHDQHRLLETEPNTWTLFIHGFKRQGWKFFVKPHTVICDYCNENNGGVCHKKDEVLDFTEFLSRAEADPSIPFSKRRTIKWLRVTPELLKQLERRKAALKKLDVKVPETKEEKYAIMKEIIVSRKKND